MNVSSLLARRIFLFLSLPSLLLARELNVEARSAEPTSGSARWENDIRAFEAADKANPPPKQGILFIGSSSIRLWKTLARDFPEHQVINRGFGGSEIADSVSFADRIVLPYEPKMIVLYAGGNDINAGKSPEQVFADFKAFVQKVGEKLAQTRIAYVSIAPNPARWGQVERVRAANALIREYAHGHERLEFIDVFSQMLGPEGKPRPEIFVEDKLHMNEKGYELWRGLIKPYLK